MLELGISFPGYVNWLSNRPLQSHRSERQAVCCDNLWYTPGIERPSGWAAAITGIDQDGLLNVGVSAENADIGVISTSDLYGRIE